MRFKLNLKTFGGNLNFNYQYALSAAIYDLVSRQDKRFADILHETGFKHKMLNMKTKFCFSRLYNLKFDFVKGESFMSVRCCNPYVFVSVVNSSLADYLVKAFFIECQIVIHGMLFTIESVEVIPEIELKNTMQIRALSPIFVRRQEDGVELKPQDEDFLESIVHNLVSKYEVYNDPLDDYGTWDGKILSEPPYKNDLVWIRGISRRAFFLDFQLYTSVPEILRYGFDLGFGGGNAQGFGYCIPIVE